MGREVLSTTWCQAYSDQAMTCGVHITSGGLKSPMCQTHSAWIGVVWVDVLVHPRQAVLLHGPQQTSLESGQRVCVQGNMESVDNSPKYANKQGLSQHSSVKRSQPKLAMVGLTHHLEWQRWGDVHKVNWDASYYQNCIRCQLALLPARWAQSLLPFVSSDHGGRKHGDASPCFLSLHPYPGSSQETQIHAGVKVSALLRGRTTVLRQWSFTPHQK